LEDGSAYGKRMGPPCCHIPVRNSIEPTNSKFEPVFLDCYENAFVTVRRENILYLTYFRVKYNFKYIYIKGD
jgi:hypothetical protein